MITHIAHFELSGTRRWGIIEGDIIHLLDQHYANTAELLLDKAAIIKTAKVAQDKLQKVNLSEVHLLSPVVGNKRVICQGANYRQHMIDSGMNPDDKKFNMFFTKSSASVCPGSSDIVCPDHVELLDYEVELGLVIGKQVSAAQQVTAENLHEYVAGIVIANDVSARDIQFSQSQFYKSKSYRTFCPVGPVLCLLEKEDMHYLDKLQLELSVNGQVRQQDSSANLVFKPNETLSEFTQMSDLDPGDLILTGTPHGCALQVDPALIKKVYSMPEDTKWEYFKSEQKKNGRYLEQGDEIKLTIISMDKKVNLGAQNNRICNA